MKAEELKKIREKYDYALSDEEIEAMMEAKVEMVEFKLGEEEVEEDG